MKHTFVSTLRSDILAFLPNYAGCLRCMRLYGTQKSEFSRLQVR